ncbi:hypothetical protein [Halobacteriovorax sp. RT-1-4]|uniref:hypothetical protein n=1 Tax=unclassified Halobacteriovorax TaxID=2639665 RepID=UPI00399A7675
MRNLLTLCLLVLILSSCTESDIVVGVDVNSLESLSVEEAFYAQAIGTCTNNTRQHRALMFTGILSREIAGERYVAEVKIILDRNAKTYDMIYSEYPFPANIDQTNFTTSLSSTYEVVENTIALNNFAIIKATVENDKISPLMEITNDIRSIIDTRAIVGRAKFYSDDDIVNECL